MRAGAINRRIYIDEPVTTQDATGDEVVTWTEFAQVWAAIEPIRGREALVNSASLAMMDTRITVRWSPEVDEVNPEWRLRYKETIYDIVSLAHIRTGKRTIEMLCKSGANNG